MSELYQDLMTGFNEILDANRNSQKLKTTVLTIPEVKHYSNDEIQYLQLIWGYLLKQLKLGNTEPTVLLVLHVVCYPFWRTVKW